MHTRLPFTHAQPDCDAFVALADPATQTEALEVLRGLTERVEVQATENTFAIELVDRSEHKLSATAC